jgi:hypothetical protein
LHESSGSVEGVSEWLPNEVDVQRYHALALGITPHLDLKRYRVLIAIVTVGHSAPFSLCKDREGTVSEQWQAEPGSLVLLRAPGLGGAEDGRPLHAVGGPPVGTRISITWRMNCGLLQGTYDLRLTNSGFSRRSGGTANRRHQRGNSRGE